MQPPKKLNKRTGKICYRRAPHLVCYWDGDRFVIANFAVPERVIANSLIVQLLHVISTWRTLPAICAELDNWDPEVVSATVRELVEHRIVRRSDQRPAPAEDALVAWDRWNPEAGFFHLMTKNAPYPRGRRDAARLWRRFGPSTPMPAPTKTYSRAAKVPLPAPEQPDDFRRVLLERRTWREFARAPMTMAELATLLQLTWGVQRWGRTAGGRVALKTSPSGGARHPGEVYVLALRVKGLKRGLYHYAAERHVLERLRSDASAKDVAAYLPGQPWYRSASALFLMTAVFGREQWRYRFARAYRAVLLDAGHLCQTCCLTATSLGLAPFCSMAFADSRVEHDLGIDGVSESMLYVAGVGTRPAHGWEPWTLDKAAATRRGANQDVG